MKISTNSWHARMIAGFYNYKSGNMPVSLCSYFWHFVWMMVTLPLSWWMFPINKHANNNDSPIGLSVMLCIVSMVLMLMGFVFVQEFFGYDLNAENSYWWILGIYLIGLIGSVAVLAGVGSIIFIIYLCYLPFKWMYKRINSKPNGNPTIVASYFKARKQKVCPIIDYQDEE